MYEIKMALQAKGDFYNDDVENALLWFNVNCRTAGEKTRVSLGCLAAIKHTSDKKCRGPGKTNTMSSILLVYLCYVLFPPFQNPHPTSHNALQPLYQHTTCDASSLSVQNGQTHLVPGNHLDVLNRQKIPGTNGTCHLN